MTAFLTAAAVAFAPAAPQPVIIPGASELAAPSPPMAAPSPVRPFAPDASYTVPGLPDDPEFDFGSPLHAVLRQQIREAEAAARAAREWVAATYAARVLPTFGTDLFTEGGAHAAATRLAAPTASRPDGPAHTPPPSPFDDRDRFLADLFAPATDWLPPRTARLEEWRTWLGARPRDPLGEWTAIPGPDGRPIGWYRAAPGGIEFAY
jgi:hypothetical protein